MVLPTESLHIRMPIETMKLIKENCRKNADYLRKTARSVLCEHFKQKKVDSMILLHFLKEYTKGNIVDLEITFSNKCVSDTKLYSKNE